MTAPLSAQRVEELVESLCLSRDAFIPLDDKEHADLLSILNSFSSMRADWDKIPEIRADKIRYKIRAEKAEAELEKVRPLIEAVMGAEIRTHEIGGRYIPNTEAILRAALALRESKGETK
jgi:hypothetical protein